MAIRQILVPLVGVGDARRLLENAFQIAIAHKAHVTVCDTVPRDVPFIDPTGMISPEAYKELIDKIESQQAHTRKASHAQFVSAAQEAGIAVSDTASAHAATACWVDSREHGSIVWSLSRLADLIIARRPVGTGIQDQEIVEEGLFSTRRPVLLIPPKAAHLERSAAIAWNGSVESATALQRAIDLLDPAHVVNVIQVGDLRPGALAATQAIAYLESYGFRAQTRFVPDVPKATGEVILRAATDAKAGILVAGAYTHSRLREEFLGGVTATLLKNAHLPVFLAH